MHLSQQQGQQDHHLCILLCALCWAQLSQQQEELLRQGQQLTTELAAQTLRLLLVPTISGLACLLCPAPLHKQ